MPKLVQDILAKGYRTTIWVHPFVNKDCEDYYKEGLEKGYFVVNSTGHTDTQWWNSKKGEAAYIDFTNSAAREWFLSRLRKLKEENKFDGFKFGKLCFLK